MSRIVLMITVVNVSTIGSLPMRCQVLCQGVCIRYHLSPGKAVRGWGYHSIYVDERGLGGGWILGFLTQVQFVQLFYLLLVVLSFAEIPGCVHILNLRWPAGKPCVDGTERRWIWSAGTCGERSGIRRRFAHPWPSDKRDGVGAVLRSEEYDIFSNLLSC